jgi:hypothetical protein
MRFLIHIAIVLVICLVGVGIWRGWFQSTRDAQGDPGFTVNTKKVKDDIGKAKAKIREEFDDHKQALGPKTEGVK